MKTFKDLKEAIRTKGQAKKEGTSAAKNHINIAINELKQVSDNVFLGDSGRVKDIEKLVKELVAITTKIDRL